jgi:membrane-associated protease RseP (regulator of RpoE activity)
MNPKSGINPRSGTNPMDDSSAHDESQVLTDIPRITPAPVYEPEVVAPSRARGAGVTRLHIALFLLTLLTTTMAGADMAGAFVSLVHPSTFGNLAAGLSFSIPLMLILFSHEMGHYVVARRNNVDVSPPYFIPAPFPSIFFIGTFGAFIRMRSPARTRRVMFDIGAAGPWAGVVPAVIAVAIGLKLSEVAPLDTTGGGLQLGNSILFWALSYAVLGVDPNSVNVNLHPIAFAGWIGLLVTTLNLLPVGQLDGGHVIYALFGRWHRTIARLFIVFCVMMVVVPLSMGSAYWGGWLFWVVFLFFLGLGHPATVDADTPLDPRRRAFAWATIALFVVTFSPVPAWYAEPTQNQDRPKDNTYSVVYRPAPPRLPASVRLKGL